MCARDLACGADGRAGRDAVVDDERGAPGEIESGPVAAVRLRSPRELDPLACLDRREVGLADAERPHHVLVDHAHAVFTDGAHRELGVERHADLADDDHVERRVERVGDLRGDRHPAAGQAEDHEVVGRKVAQPVRQLPARVGTVSEHLTPRSDRSRAARPGPTATCARGARARACRRSG